MVWWEAVLSPALQVLFDRLAAGDITELLRGWNIDDLLLEKLRIAYFTNTAVLEDAEEKQYTIPAVETWLDMLKNAVYEAEDTLDELATEALRYKLESNSQVLNWRFNSTSLYQCSEGTNVKIERIIDKLEFIAKRKDVLGLKSDGGGAGKTVQRTPSTPLSTGSQIYGRDDDKEEVIQILLSRDETSDVNFSVIPILGMGGIGKTTLAQMAYNDSKMDEYFDVKAWACVSDEFNVVSITKSLLESANNKPCDTMNLEILQGTLRKKLRKKRFLIVLDDVWNESYENWNDLIVPFLVGAKKSKIILTARNEEVLSVMNTLPPYRLKEMSDHGCWSLFRHHAFGNKNSDSFRNLEVIGRKIANKCKGLPLAAKTLGSLLASKLDTNYWTTILNNNLWDLPPKKNAILPALLLSYHHLPTNLKRCFAYCSIFPKDYEFDRKDLLLLWMAEGFVHQVVKTKNMEEAADEYFADLLSRSFFQESTQNKSHYVMHHLINDLAQFVSRKKCIRLEGKLEKFTQGETVEKARHFSYVRNKYDVFRKFESLYELKWLRTFLPLASPSGPEICYLTKKVPLDLLPNMRYLRVLSLSGYCITELPDSIGNLKHLRYLNLSNTEIDALPQSLSSLYNLQTLLLRECSYLSKLPADIGKLINLRHLDISGSGIQEFPQGINNLINLRTLPEFIISCASGSGISELRNLLYLQGALSISRLENVGNVRDARRASLEDKKEISELVMRWSTGIDEPRDARVEKDVLEMLQPNQNIEKITLVCYSGTLFPTWIGDPSYSKLVFLHFSYCERCVSLPPLGQLRSLKKLYIEGMNGVKSVGDGFYGAFLYPSFPSLEILSFKDMLEWEDWYVGSCEELEVFPHLHELYIEKCPKLKGKFPNNLPSLTKLVIWECEQLTSSLPRLALLCELDLQGCKESLVTSGVDFPLLASLTLHNIPNLSYLPEGLIKCLTQLERLAIVDCHDLMYITKDFGGLHFFTSLRYLIIRNCTQLVFLFEEEQQLLDKLEYLELDSCHSLENLPHALYGLTSLQELAIMDCPRLATLPETDFPPKLRGLAIRGCGLESLPEATVHNKNGSLEYLYISGCLLLNSFPQTSEVLPTTFKHLTIDQCPNLESLPVGMMHRNNLSLQVLEIFDCSSITSFPTGHLPYTLKTLTIWNCSNLWSLADVIMETMALESLRIGNCTSLKSLPNTIHKLQYLDYMEIDGCPGLVSFPQGGFPITSLRKVHIINCENLKSLPERMRNLTSLQELHLSDCPCIMSFPEYGLPINLKSLEIKNCERFCPLSEWGLHSLTSLKKFSIYGGNPNLATFSDWLLPSSLTTLHLGQLFNLGSFSNWLTNLSSLEELRIKGCHRLHSLPKEGLPETLCLLEISDCPMLEQHCEKNWPKIDHIPCILM